MKPILLPLLVLAAACGAANDPDRSQESSRSSSSDSGRTLFVQSAVEHSDGTVTLPLYRGTSRGRTVWYILLDSSSDNDAQARGINKSQKLANARGSKAVQKVAVQNGVVDFPASVNFAFGTRTVVPGPQGFPPQTATYAAAGEDGTARSSSSPTAPSRTRRRSPTTWAAPPR